MTATPARIGFIEHEFRTVTATDTLAKDKYGNLARQSDDPIETFFDNTVDAQAVCNARQSLLGGDRRRFRVGAKGLAEIMALSYSKAIPIVRYEDEERDCFRSMLVGDITFDFAKNSVTMTLWG